MAVAMLLKSTKPGRHSHKYTQFETMHKLRAAFSNLYHSSNEGSGTTVTLGRDTTCPTQSMWFERFAKGCLKRMGQEVHQDLAVSIHLMLAFQDLLEEEWREKTQLEDRIKLAMVGAYALVAFGGSFRGHEVFYLETFGLLKYAAGKHVERGQEFLVVPLLGRYKSEDAERYHLTPLALKTDSGLQIGRWVYRLADAKRA